MSVGCLHVFLGQLPIFLKIFLFVGRESKVEHGDGQRGRDSSRLNTQHEG